MVSVRVGGRASAQSRGMATRRDVMADASRDVLVVACTMQGSVSRPRGADCRLSRDMQPGCRVTADTRQRGQAIVPKRDGQKSERRRHPPQPNAQNHAQKSPPSGRAMAHAQAMRQQQHRRVHREPNACSAARNTLSTARRVATPGRSQNEKLTLLRSLCAVSIPLSFLHGSWGVGAGRDGGEWHTSPDPPCAICSHHSHL